MKNKIMIGLLATLLGLAAQAQTATNAEDETVSTEIQVGAGRSYFNNTKVNANEVSAALYIARKGSNGFLPMIVIPVSVTFGKDIQMYTAGAGVTTTGVEDQLFSHQISLAAAKLINDDPHIIDPANANRFGLLLQNQIGFNLSNRLHAALSVNLDLLNGLRSSKNAQETLNTINKETDGDRWALRDKAIKEDYHLASMTSFSFKLTYSLFKKK